jgi:hypothetical protein
MKLGDTFFVGVEEGDELYEYNDYEYHSGPLYESEEAFETDWKDTVRDCRCERRPCPKKPMLVKVKLVIEE